MSNVVPRRHWGRRLLLLSCSVAASLLLLEFGLRLAGVEPRTPRWFDPDVGWRFYPDQIVHMRRNEVALGSATIVAGGYRTPSWPPPHPPGGLAVACVGDSFTFGWAVADDESWPAELQQQIDLALGAGRARVRNFGMPGWNSVNEDLQYPRDVRPWSPSLVLIGYCLNDLQPQDQGPRHLSGPLFHWARDTALLVAFNQYVQPRLPWSWISPAPEPPALARLRLEYEPRRKEILSHPDGIGEPYWRRADEALERLVASVRADGVPVGLIVFPNDLQVDMLRKAGVTLGEAPGGFGAVDRPQRHLASVAARLQLPMLDLLPAFVDMEDEPFHELDPGHPSAAAYAIAAREIMELLRSEDWLPAR
jgi:lysophospholipase L1-like esterase